MSDATPTDYQSDTTPLLNETFFVSYSHATLKSHYYIGLNCKLSNPVLLYEKEQQLYCWTWSTDMRIKKKKRQMGHLTLDFMDMYKWSANWEY